MPHTVTPQQKIITGVKRNPFSDYSHFSRKNAGVKHLSPLAGLEISIHILYA
jgi:hypothetical protein